MNRAVEGSSERHGRQVSVTFVKLLVIKIFRIKSILVDGCLHPQRHLIILARNVNLIT
jgi:hypothetical protein